MTNYDEEDYFYQGHRTSLESLTAQAETPMTERELLVTIGAFIDGYEEVTHRAFSCIDEPDADTIEEMYAIDKELAQLKKRLLKHINRNLE